MEWACRTPCAKIAGEPGRMPQARQILKQKFLDGLPRRPPHPPSNFLARWRCRVIEGRVVDWERLGGGDGRDRDDGGRDWSRLGRALAAAEQEAARRFGSPCGDRLGRA